MYTFSDNMALICALNAAWETALMLSSHGYVIQRVAGRSGLSIQIDRPFECDAEPSITAHGSKTFASVTHKSTTICWQVLPA